MTYTRMLIVVSLVFMKTIKSKLLQSLHCYTHIRKTKWVAEASGGWRAFAQEKLDLHLGYDDDFNMCPESTY